MIFRQWNEEPIEIMLRNEIIYFKKSTQFLRMTLDSRLNWEEHNNKLRAKEKSIKFYKCGSREKKADRKILETVQFNVQDKDGVWLSFMG